ncbi:uncharacterized protein [Epargyreus clarus]|uniref:uncharacterized protein isoform X1 n=1 Tax=Epargyreus clarus TaxID=520877 RepID=UPI003C3061D1
MKSAKSNRSLRSIKSSRSMKSTKLFPEGRKGDVGGEFLDLANVLPTACAKFQCPYNIVVKKESQRDEFYKALKYGDAKVARKKLSIMPPQATIVSQQSEVKTSATSKSEEGEPCDDANALTIIAMYDTYNCLSEIILSKVKVPRIMMQVMGLLLPYFPNLITLTVRRCRIECYIIYEISKMLELSCITTLCLDESPVVEQNYDMLLCQQSNLRNLSLCRCKINDDACKLIALKLCHGAPAENLQVLNLSSNHITDIGAKYLGDALRTNRRLRYLNLADNRIGDDGAAHVLNVLMEFPLTHDEVVNKRLRYIKYLKCKQALYLRYLNECATKSFDEISMYSRKSTPKRKKPTRKDKDSFRYSDEDIKGKAEMLAAEILGNFIDPFDSTSIRLRNNYYYCLGNMVLSYLNMSYNNLSYLSIKKLQNVLMYQSVAKKPNQSGLVKAVIDGNNLPMCKELVFINELFGRNLKNYTGKPELGKKRLNRLSKIL